MRAARVDRRRGRPAHGAAARQTAARGGRGGPARGRRQPRRSAAGLPAPRRGHPRGDQPGPAARHPPARPTGRHGGGARRAGHPHRHRGVPDPDPRHRAVVPGRRRRRVGLREPHLPDRRHPGHALRDVSAAG
ncbi:conserved hypothetical protein [Streptomyces misionensis JCM 4497]